jgi:L-lactate dehydrogenase complex protein LldG
MSDARERFLNNVRRAVAQGNRASGASERPTRGDVGYQGAGANLIAHFVKEFSAAGGQAHVVPDPAAAVDVVKLLLREHACKRILLGRGSFLDTLDLATILRAMGCEVARTDTVDDSSAREAFFQADLGVSGVDFLVAETGTVVLRSQPNQPQSLSLLPAVHVAIASRDQVLADLFDLFAEDRLRKEALPSSVTLITGPSKTGDIELRLVTGVHGPGTIHVVLVDHR